MTSSFVHWIPCVYLLLLSNHYHDVCAIDDFKISVDGGAIQNFITSYQYLLSEFMTSYTFPGGEFLVNTSEVPNTEVTITLGEIDIKTFTWDNLTIIFDANTQSVKVSVTGLSAQSDTFTMGISYDTGIVPLSCSGDSTVKIHDYNFSSAVLLSNNNIKDYADVQYIEDLYANGQNLSICDLGIAIDYNATILERPDLTDGDVTFASDSGGILNLACGLAANIGLEFFTGFLDDWFNQNFTQLFQDSTQKVFANLSKLATDFPLHANGYTTSLTICYHTIEIYDNGDVDLSALLLANETFINQTTLSSSSQNLAAMDIKHIPDSIILIVFSPFILIFCCIGCCNSYCFIRDKCCKKRNLRKVTSGFHLKDDEYDKALLQEKGGAGTNYKRMEDDDNYL